MTLAIREGLTYSPRWFDQQEGPYTYLAKLAIANRTSLTTLLAAIFGVRGSSASSTLRTHSLTCVEDRWMKRGGRATAGSIAQSLSQRTLSDVFGDRAGEFASDEHFRYCSPCLDRGFQSPLCQLDALVRCPVHHAPILQVCRACQAPTGRYAFDSAFLQKLRCTNCGKPLGRAWDDDGLMRWPVTLDTSAYGTLATSLRQVKRTTWLDSRGWDDHFDLLPVADKRVANLGLALHALDLPISQCSLHPALAGGVDDLVRVEAYRSTPQSPAGKVEEVFRDLWGQLIERAGGIKRLLDALRNETFKAVGSRRMVEWVGSDDRKTLATFLWCIRFGHWSDFTKVHVRKHAMPWAKDADLSRDDWTRLFLLAFKAEERFAGKWCSMTSHLSRQSIEWRQLVAQYADVLRSGHAQSTAVIAIATLDHEGSENSGRVKLAYGMGSSYFPL